MHNFKRKLEENVVISGALEYGEIVSSSGADSIKGVSSKEPDEKKQRIESLDTLLPLLLDNSYQFNFEYDSDLLQVEEPLGLDTSNSNSGFDIYLGNSPTNTTTCMDFGDYDISNESDLSINEESIINELSKLVEAVEKQNENFQELQTVKNVEYEVVVEKIPVWRVYYADQKDNMIPKYSEFGKKFQVNATINSKISCWFGDITNLKVDAIVNSTTHNFGGEHGVDRCIHAAAGERLKQQCEQKLATVKFLEVGEASITDSFSLPCKYIIHTNGPCGDVPGKLSSCYQKSMNLLLEKNLKTIAFPCISTGKKGYSHANAARIALRTIRYYLRHDRNNKVTQSPVFVVAYKAND